MKLRNGKRKLEIWESECTSDKCILSLIPIEIIHKIMEYLSFNDQLNLRLANKHLKWTVDQYINFMQLLNVDFTAKSKKTLMNFINFIKTKQKFQQIFISLPFILKYQDLVDIKDEFKLNFKENFKLTLPEIHLKSLPFLNLFSKFCTQLQIKQFNRGIGYKDDLAKCELNNLVSLDIHFMFQKIIAYDRDYNKNCIELIVNSLEIDKTKLKNLKLYFYCCYVPIEMLIEKLIDGTCLDELCIGGFEIKASTVFNISKFYYVTKSCSLSMPIDLLYEFISHHQDLSKLEKLEILQPFRHSYKSKKELIDVFSFLNDKIPNLLVFHSSLDCIQDLIKSGFKFSRKLQELYLRYAMDYQDFLEFYRNDLLFYAHQSNIRIFELSFKVSCRNLTTFNRVIELTENIATKFGSLAKVTINLCCCEHTLYTQDCPFSKSCYGKYEIRLKRVNGQVSSVELKRFVHG